MTMRGLISAIQGFSGILVIMIMLAWFLGSALQGTGGPPNPPCNFK
jgi:sugar phosphate permease